jgi:hypothetical protein
MRLVNSLFLSPSVNNWLTDTHHPRILHVFDHACNLLNERGDVLSIVTAQIGNGPFNLVVEENIHFLEHLTPDSSVFSSIALLKLGELTIHTKGATLWSPRPDWEMLHTKRNEIPGQIKHLPITNYRINSDLPISQSLTSSLYAALVHSDVSTATSSASQLAGLGIGLTPSGDDFMMGAIYAAWIIHPPEVASVIAREIVNTAASLTTSLSAAWLRAAGRGEAGIVWHEFFDALLSNDSLRIQETLRNILAVGETSGEDALAGFTGVFKALMEKAGSLHG